jgi:chromosome partitioning protein
VSTSGLVHAGLGWPSKGPAGDDDSYGDLGWPTSPLGEETPEPGPTPESETAPEGDNRRAVGFLAAPSSEQRIEDDQEVSRGVRGAIEEGREVARGPVKGAREQGQEPTLDPTDRMGATQGTTASVSRETQITPASVPDDNGSVSRETTKASLADLTTERDQLAASLPDPGAETPLAQAVAADARRRISLTGKVFPKPDHTRILTVANQKGGVGKTTTTVNIAAALAQAGLKVLVIDIDPQGNASTALGIDHHAEVPSIYDVLLDGKAVTEVVQECVDVPNLWCIPATIDLAGAEIELVSVVARETRMNRALSAYIVDMADRGEERLDYVLIDCPPSLGLLTVNAFVAADEVLIPIQCEYYALEGLSQLLKNVELIKSHLNPVLHVSTILLTMYDGRTRLSAQVADEVRSHFPAHVLRTTVPRSVRISEAPSHGQTVMTYDPGSSGALSYLEAASELADRGVSG